MMYIEHSYYFELPKRCGAKPRDRYIQYYRDLHKRYNEKLEERSFFQGSHYKFHEMGYVLMDKCFEDGCLDKIDLMIICYWAHEYDPDFASCGPHFSYRYGFQCNMFDVIDQGSICTFTALSLADQFQQNDSSERTLLISLDQTTNPRADTQSIPIPTIDAAAGLVLCSRKNNKDLIKTNLIRIIAIQVWTEQQVCKERFDIMKLVITQLEKNRINPSECILYCKKNTSIYKSMQIYYSNYKNIIKEIEINNLPLELGCSLCLKSIFMMINDKTIPSRRYVLILDEDVESFTIGLMILEYPNSRRSHNEN